MRSKIVFGLLGLVFASAACGIDTDEPAAAPQVEAAQPSGAPEESEASGSQDDPLPAGTRFVMSGRSDGEDDLVELWEITLGTTDTDATDEVLAENPGNQLAEGRTAVMTEVTATYVGPATGNAWADLNYTYLGSDGDTFAFASDDSCGTIPNDLFNYGELAPGTTVTGNICQAVPEDEIDGGLWIVAFAFTVDDRRVYVNTE
jgi:hypothetical protein